MIPNMYKIAGELTPTVFHVAARAAGHARAVDLRRPQRRHGRAGRPAGRCSPRGSVQEAHGPRARSPTPPRCESRMPFLHFFDGFRTSHEVDKIDAAGPDDDIRAMIDEGDVRAHRAPRHCRPTARSSAARPRTPTSTSRPARPSTRYYLAVPGHRAGGDGPSSPSAPGAATTCSTTSARPTPSASSCIMGSGAGDGRRRPWTTLTAAGEKVGVVQRAALPPVPDRATLVAALPPTVRAIAVLDRTQGAGRHRRAALPRTSWPRSTKPCRARSRRFTALTARHRRPLRPLLEGVHARDGQGASSTSLRAPAPKNHFTVGITTT